MNKNDKQQIPDRVSQIRHSLLDAMEGIATTLAGRFAQTKPDATPLQRDAPAHVARRQAANTLRLAQFCANRACRRAHSCQGEPLHCLQTAMPLLGADALDGLLQKSRPGRAAPRRVQKRGSIKR